MLSFSMTLRSLQVTSQLSTNQNLYHRTNTFQLLSNAFIGSNQWRHAYSLILDILAVAHLWLAVSPAHEYSWAALYRFIQFACFFHFSPTKDLAPFSIHIPTKKPSSKPITYCRWHMLSTAKSGNVGFRQVLQWGWRQATCVHFSFRVPQCLPYSTS